MADTKGWTTCEYKCREIDAKAASFEANRAVITWENETGTKARNYEFWYDKFRCVYYARWEG